MTPMIEVRRLSKVYTSSPKNFALDQVDVLIRAGDIFGFVGSSGAGKSTLLRCLTGLEKPTHGSVVIEGKDISSMTQPEIRAFRQNIGMVFQQFHLFPSKTVAENIAFPMEIYGVPVQEQHARIEELLELVGLSHKKNVYPTKLSGGEKQRIGIARALANRPHLLFCDEATSALDPTSTRSILNLLQTLNEKLGLTIVLITHQIEAVKQICNRMAVMSHGRIIEAGEVADIFTCPLDPATKQLLHPLAEQLPDSFLKGMTPFKKLVSLTFKEEQAKQPVISKLIKNYDVEVNILLGSLDCFRKTVLGSLVVELTGSQESIQQALDFLETNLIYCEVLA